MLSESGGTNLFVSGTASIVGYETIHPGDVTAQTRETLANIDALLEEANRVVGAPRYSLDGLKLKVYVRRPEDLAAIRRALSPRLRPRPPSCSCGRTFAARICWSRSRPRASRLGRA